MTCLVTPARPALAPRVVVARIATSKSRACAFGSSPGSLEPRRGAPQTTPSTPLRRRFTVAARASASPQVSAELAAKATKTATATASGVSSMPVSLGAVLASSFAFPALWAFAAVPCCLAFLNPVYVFSVGYGLSVAAQAAGIAAMLHASGVWVPAALAAHLAGAERQKKTNANGARLNEAMSINKDLMVLGHCLRDLRWNQSHPKASR